MKIELPAEFIRTIQNVYFEKGKYWLEAFPAVLEEAARRWDLTDIQPVPNLSYNFVAAALRNPPSIFLQPQDGALPQGPRGSAQEQVILKLGVPQRELSSEIAALRLYNGRGACRLLDADAGRGMLLLEHLHPGHALATLEHDDRATQIAAEVMKNLWESSNDLAKVSAEAGSGEVAISKFIQLRDWFDGFQRLRMRFNGGTGPLPERLVETAESLSRELILENKDESLLHGDFHHFNLLASARGWLAIDPKGVIGPRGYEAGPFLINPAGRFLNEGDPATRAGRRIAILSESLGMERERIRNWGFCHAVLSAWWSIEDNDPGRDGYSLRCAELFRQLRV